MIKGDRIKLVKKMGAFDNIGEICEVTDIQEGGVICFKFGGYHLGHMTSMKSILRRLRHL